MSELKHQLMLNKDMSWVPCYLKSEADKEILKLKEENESLKYSVAALETDLAMSQRWRKCSDEMPSNGQEVLVWLTAGGSHGFVLTSTYLDSQWYYGEDPQGCKPSHWMPLPSAPKEDK